MQVIVLLLVAVLCCGNAHGAMPQSLNYQGYLTSPAGTPVSATVVMTFKLYDAATAGTLKWTEIQPSVTVANGLFNVALGTVTPLPPLAFDAPYWLTVTINADGEMSPRQPVLASAYAIRAANADALAATATVPGSQISGATSANTPNTIVKRDASGNFAAGTITATLAGNAATATKLATAQPLVQRISYTGQTSRALATTSPAVKLRDLGTFTSHGVPATVTWTSAIGGSGTVCNFQLRIDGTASGTVNAHGLVGNEANIAGTVDAVPATIVDVFGGLTAGTRMVELWYRSVAAACTENVGNYTRVVQVVEHGATP